MACNNINNQPYQYIGNNNQTTLQPELDAINADITVLYGNVNVLNDEVTLLFQQTNALENKTDALEFKIIETSYNLLETDELVFKNKDILIDTSNDVLDLGFMEGLVFYGGFDYTLVTIASSSQYFFLTSQFLTTIRSIEYLLYFIPYAVAGDKEANLYII